MSELHDISLNHEEVAELERILQHDLTETMIEERRSSPNSNFKNMMHRRVELVKGLLARITAASHAPTA